MSSKRGSTRKLVISGGLAVVLGTLMLVAIAYAATTVGTYSDGTYLTPKPKFGRGLENVYSKMIGGVTGQQYFAEYWEPLGTSKLLKKRHGPFTADGNGAVMDVYTTTFANNTGLWQSRFIHNPNYAEPGKIVIDSPLPGATIVAGTPVVFKFHLEDKNGNLYTTDKGKNINVTFKDGATIVWRTRSATRKNNQDGWAFSAGYYTWTGSNNVATYTPLANDNVLYLGIEGKNYLGNGPEPNDTYDMFSLEKHRYWKAGNPPSADITYYPYSLVGVDSLNPKIVANPLTTTVNYTYYFDLLDFDGTPLTADGYVWTRFAYEANDYDGDLTQTAKTGTTPVYDATAGHWKTTFTLDAPGKYGIVVTANKVNAPTDGMIVNFAASTQFTMSGDITPPGNVTGYGSTAGDSQVTLNWTNPGDSDFAGVLILRRKLLSNDPADYPRSGQPYSTDGSGGNPSTIGNSRVVYLNNGVQHIDGDPCVVTQRLENDSIYYYKAFTYDDKLNYSSGVEISNTPFDTTPPDPVSGVTVTPGDGVVTVNWTNPPYSTSCDFDGVMIRYRTDGSFPSDRLGGDGSLLAGTKTGGTAGDPDFFIHTNLTNGFPYYYTIWTHDDDGNWNETGQMPVTYATPKDSTNPGQITDLRIIPGSVTAFDVGLQWTSSGDDGAAGQATEYEIHYFDQPLSDANWGSGWMATGSVLPVPQPVGATQQYTVTGLRPLTQYYFAIRAIDEAGNWSTTSRGPGDTDTTETTLCNEQLTGCNQCHLMPPNDDLPGAHPRGTGNIGAHYLPIHTSGADEQCNTCHGNGEVWRNNTTLYEFNHQNDVIEVNDPGKIGNAAERDAGSGGTFHRFTTIVYKFKEYSSGVGYKQKSGYCTNTYCHGTVLATPRWGLDHITCGETCHETPPATGRHVKHYHPGLYYYNFGPAGTLLSGYTNDSGSGWSNSPTTTDRGSDPQTGGNTDKRYATFLSNVPGTTSTKTFNVANGTYYVTVCVGDPSAPSSTQNVEISGNGAGGPWISLLTDYNTTNENLHKKVVDKEVIVSGDNNLMVRIGNGTATHLNYMIINSVPEAPKSNTTVLLNTANGYGFTCGKCHTSDTTQSKHTQHVNGLQTEGLRHAEVAFDANAFPKNPMASYTTVFGSVSSFVDGQAFKYTTGRSCVNTYCHGSTLDAGGSNTTPRWLNGWIDIGGASLCGACHDAGYADTTPFTSMSTGSHYKHVTNRFAYRFDCYKCHYKTAGEKDGSGVVPIANKIRHVNGDVDAYFDENDNTMKFGRYSTSIKTCYNVYCHSNGLLKNNAPYWATEYSLPVWDSGTKSCNYCHGTGNSKGRPDYTNMTSTPNSHMQHAEANGIVCQNCHHDTTRDGLTIYTTMQPSLHVNGVKDVVFNGVNQGASYNSSNKSCSSTYCHGLSADPTWGDVGGVTCGSCHGVTPADPNPGIGGHNVHNNGNYGNISSTQANKSSGTTYDFDCRFCHFYRVHGSGPYESGKQVAEVNFNLINVTNAYNNTGATYSQGTNIYTDGNNWQYTDGRCLNTMCHSDGRGGLPNNTSFKWTDASLDAGGLQSCTGCHSQRAVANKKMSTDHHPKHVWESVYRKKCEDCHSDTVVGDITINDTSFHVNGKADVNINDVWGPTATYTAGSRSCSEVDCHSNAKLAPDDWNGPDSEWFVTVDWDDVTGSTCTTCHSDSYYPGGQGARTLAKQTLSYNHRKHTDTTAAGGYGSRYQCVTCHEMTVTNSFTLQTSVPTMHNNQQKDVYYKVPYFNMTGPNTRNPGLDAYWGSWNTPVPGNCTVICHANGANPTTADAPVRFPNWSAAMGSYGCGSCHRDRTNGLNTGSHWTHINPATNDIDCGACHSNTAYTSVTFDGFSGAQEINASGYDTYHVNGALEVVLGVGGSWSSPNCSGTTVSTCHPGTSPNWGTVATCSDCHMDAGAIGTETDDFTSPGGSTATINTLEWQNAGHGRQSASGDYPYTGNPAANFPGCTTNCHDNANKHKWTTNPFGLVSTATIKPTQPDTLCLSCHDGVIAVSAANHDLAHVGQGTWSFTPKCVDCHDPHGDNGGVTTGNYNAAMIHSDVSYTVSSTYGAPGTTEAVDFPVDWPGDGMLNWSSFVNNNASNKGICRVCHTDTNNTYFRRDLYTSHNSTQGACASCHSHGNGFKPSACDSCHGNPPNAADGKSDNVGAVGAHSLHYTTLGVTCDKCHGHNGSGPQHNESGVSAGYSGLLTNANVDVTISTTYDHGGTAAYNGASGSWSPDKTCSNLSCHYSTSKAWDCP